MITMSVTLRATPGCTEAVISDDGSLNLFYQVAAIVNDDLGLKFLNKEDEFDSLHWDFKYKGQLLTLHYNIYTGISVFYTQTKDTIRRNNKEMIEMASLLEQRVGSLAAMRKIA